MHIAIDARMYGTAQRGIGRYLMKLIDGLEEIESAPPLTRTTPGPSLERRGNPRQGGENCYTIFLRRENFEEYQPRNTNFKKALWDAPWYGLREQIGFRPLFTASAVRGKTHDREFFPAPRPIDIYHFPHWDVPLLFRRPFVVTIHDLELFSSNRTRENSTRGRLTYWLKFQAFKLVFRHAVLAARGIIVPSNVVREQLLDLYPQVRKKTHVIYEAPTIDANGYRLAASAPVTSISTNAKPYPLYPNPYILYVGAAYPHKNLSRLLEAWKIVHAQLPDYKLVLVGREDFFWKKLKLEIGNWKLEIGDSVVWYGEATDAELATLYQNAALLIQPSLEEGFSLPPLEALAHGTPVAVSDIPVHREILDNAAAYFNPRDPAAIAKTIIGTLQTPVAAPLPRAYSWKVNADQTLAIYAAAVKTGCT
ncbi:glycosyltransferase family 4 protein [Candidatus Uhrbacteria bacterium]|nr:glycosyltransferase family 4 protein [Candidatus Uhrbacteria bacterium]